MFKKKVKKDNVITKVDLDADSGDEAPAEEK